MSTTRWLRVEGLAVLVLAVLLYARLGYGWGMFALLLLVPDVSMLGYLAGRRAGAVVYNLAHTYTVPLLLAAAAVLRPAPEGIGAALIWFGHIGMDRMLGYGLKRPTGFQDTHLGRIGRAAPSSGPTAA